jgi:hypothetical protein
MRGHTRGNAAREKLPWKLSLKERRFLTRKI